MTIGRLWYVRRGQDKKGPFPAAQIERNISLGRIRASDQISHDGDHWEPAHTYPFFEELAKNLQLPQVQARLDERQAERRAPRPVGPADDSEQRQGADRRQPEDREVVARRARAQRVWKSLHHEQHNKRRIVEALVLIGLVLGLVSILGRGPSPRSVSQCAHVPAPGVNWDFCQKPAAPLKDADLAGASLRNAGLVGSDLGGANLAAADLSYADLSLAKLPQAKLAQARLVGATLRGAALNDVDLRDADMTYVDLKGADITGARLEGARLANAIWIDGTVCSRDSVTRCSPVTK
ncbi:MAG: pentapeptide repeat-containing protein [Gammaproteobacteria bacterium]|nr:pentapeptide repeat-containing protein [Gammaproteobacteria bacterium]